MKNGKGLVLIITSLILVVFVGLSFLIYDKSDAVIVKGTTGSYAEIFAKNNELEFIAIADSDNPNVDIPVKDVPIITSWSNVPEYTNRSGRSSHPASYPP